MRTFRELLDFQDEVFMRAVGLGCTPVHTGLSWECRCPNVAHGVGGVCSVLTVASLDRFQDEREQR